MLHGKLHPAPEPVGSPRRVCIDGGGTWDAETQTCTLPDPREEVPPRQLPKGNQVFITDPKGVKRIQTPETLEQAKRDIDIKKAEIGAKQLIAEQSRQRAIEEEERILQETGAPVRRELDPTLEPGEEFPVLGPLLVKIRKALKEQLSQSIAASRLFDFDDDFEL